MAYSDIEIYTRDIDWFIQDSQLINIHAASAGRNIPDIIIQNNILNEDLLNQFLNLPKKYEKIETNPNLQNMGIENTKEYLSDFIDMAQKGFYSFDKTNINNPDDDRYHLVAYPVNYDYSDEIFFPNEFMITTNLKDYFAFKENMWAPFDLVEMVNQTQENN